MDDDLTDTVINARPSRTTGRSPAADDLVDEDTLIRGRPESAGDPPAPVETAAVDPAPVETAPVETAAVERHPPGRHQPADDPDGLADASTPHPYRFSVNGEPPLSTATATIIGRSPGGPRLPDAVAPRLLAVPSPLNEVSATHLDVRQQGASVVVTDLRSTNGTIVTAPGSPPVRLRPGESYVAVPGSLVDIGDGNSLEILAMDRMSPADLDGRGRVDS